ncbi:MAG TPA: hypothetical protein VIO11_02715 [Candidatus Methanoperedens sp.]
MDTLSKECGAIFGVDSKKHIKQWQTSEGVVKEFRSNIGVVVNPLDIVSFEDSFEQIQNELFEEFEVERQKKIYKSADIGSLFPMQENKINAFHVAFTRKILNLDDLKIAYCFTRINSKYLEDNKVTIFGNYGYATKKVDVKSFINILDSYYNALCGWKVMKKTGIINSTFLFDGMEGIYPTKAWYELKAKNNIQISYSGDQTNPILATADILVKTLDIFLKKDYDPLNEKTIEKIIGYDKKVDTENIFYVYIGNPDLESIKPLEDRQFTLKEMSPVIKRPIIFVSKGSLPGQRDVLENLPIYPKIHDLAYGLHAGVRVYEPKKDSQIIGRGNVADYFISLTSEADQQYQLLKRGGAKIEKLEIE